MFQGRELTIVTKHGKENIFFPLFEQHFKIGSYHVPEIDTDQLGTFTGEVERSFNPLETVKRKCQLGHVNTGNDLVIANEGSFGPHPDVFFTSIAEEIIYLIDYHNNIECFVKHISFETNFLTTEITSIHQLKRFVEKAKFPSHALIIRKDRYNSEEIIKGIKHWDTLVEHTEEYLLKFGKCLLETDMRAMNNPTRMKVIEEATNLLIQKLQNSCPQCCKPGFGRTKSNSGLPCSLCGLPTSSLFSYDFECSYCHHTETIFYPYQKKVEDPMYCNYCNP